MILYDVDVTVQKMYGGRNRSQPQALTDVLNTLNLQSQRYSLSFHPIVYHWHPILCLLVQSL